MNTKPKKQQPSPVHEIRKHSRQLVRELDVVKGVYLGTGYTFTQCHVMYEMLTNGPLPLMEIANNLLIDKSNTSRTVKKLVELGLATSEKVDTDNRKKLFRLTTAGKKALQTTMDLANQQVSRAIENLTDSEQETVINGMRLYAEALRKGRLQNDFTIRPIKKQDNEQLSDIIRDVMMEFQAVGEGYSIGDAEVDNMYGNYRDKNSCYFVIQRDEKIVGGGGIGPLSGGAASICELRKMFFRAPTRGIGLGRKLLMLLLTEARKRNYKTCYLETLDRMGRANDLYRKNGFKLLEAPLGSTGHCACDRWYALEL